MLNTMIRKLTPLAALALGTALSGCDGIDIKINGEKGVPLAELDMSGPPPDELVVSGPDKVILTQGDTLDITVDGDNDDADKVRFHRDGDLLGVTRSDSDWGESSAVTINITMPAPREIVIGGSGDVVAATMARDASIAIGGSGNVVVNQIDAERLEVTIGGSGSVSATGTTKRLEMTIGGNGTGKFADLKADDVEISIGGSGNVSLRSDGEVEANIGGSGNIDVIGEATCTLKSFGSGTLNCKPASDETTSGEAEVAT